MSDNPDGGSMVPIYAALLALLAVLHLAIGAIAWSMPAGKWLVGAGALILVGCTAVFANYVRRNR